MPGSKLRREIDPLGKRDPLIPGGADDATRTYLARTGKIDLSFRSLTTDTKD